MAYCWGVRYGGINNGKILDCFHWTCEIYCAFYHSFITTYVHRQLVYISLA